MYLTFILIPNDRHYQSLLIYFCLSLWWFATLVVLGFWSYLVIYVGSYYIFFRFFTWHNNFILKCQKLVYPCYWNQLAHQPRYLLHQDVVIFVYCMYNKGEMRWEHSHYKNKINIWSKKKKNLTFSPWLLPTENCPLACFTLPDEHKWWKDQSN